MGGFAEFESAVEMRMLALLFILAGAPLVAFEIDYAALFRAHEDDVRQVDDDLRILELDGPVVINERTNSDGEVSYTAIDQSEFGAAGCVFRILLELVAATRQCEGILEPEEIARLEASLTETAQFVAANAFPKVPPDEVMPRLRARLKGNIDTTQTNGDTICRSPDGGEPGFAEFARNLSQPAIQKELEQVFSLPRLPVVNPCL